MASCQLELIADALVFQAAGRVKHILGKILYHGHHPLDFYTVTGDHDSLSRSPLLQLQLSPFLLPVLWVASAGFKGP